MNQPDMRQLLQQAQKMQEQMMQAQSELASQTFEGSAGGAMVKATVTGDSRLVSVEIDPAVIDPSDPEMLGDLVVAAVNGALSAATAAAESSMGGLTGGLGGLLG